MDNKIRVKMDHLKMNSVRGASFLVALVAGLLICAGCGGGSGEEPSGQSDEGMLPEAIAVRDAFADAHVSYRNPINELLGIAKAGSENPAAYVEVLPPLERLAADPNLTPEQKQALDALVARLKSELSAARRR